jgi:hypothetical protein
VSVTIFPWECDFFLLTPTSPGIGGVRDIFHGVRQGVDTFDCVHPSRIARHGGALVMAAHWSEKALVKGINKQQLLTIANKWKKADSLLLYKRLEFFNKMLPAERTNLRAYLLTEKADALARNNTATAVAASLPESVLEARKETRGRFVGRKIVNTILLMKDVRTERLVVVNTKTNELVEEEELATLRKTDVISSVRGKTLDETSSVAEGKNKEQIKESIHILRSQYREDPRPIDPTCGCYTCRTFSRAYLHHVFKAKESVAGTLVSLDSSVFLLLN